MHKIEITKAVKIGDVDIESIEVHPLKFVDLAALWRKAANPPKGVKPETALQRERIKKQAKFIAKDAEVPLTDDALQKLPLIIARDIIDALELGAGTVGEVLNDGDGVTKAVIYKLGSPFAMKDGKGTSTKIEELEFLAETYGDVEDVLSADNDMAAALELVRRVAKPLGTSMLVMPSWAVDALTVADGLGIMRNVLSRF